MTPKIFERLESKLKLYSKPNPRTGCIEWTRRLVSGAIPQIMIDYEHFAVHRLILVKKLGRPIKPGHEAARICNNFRCIAEDHIVEQPHGIGGNKAASEYRWRQ